MSAPLDIVRVMPFFHLGRGGSVAQAQASCAELARRGHRVRVLTSDLEQAPGVPRDRWLQQDGYDVFYARVSGSGRVPPYRQPGVAHALQHCLPEADVLCLHVGLTMLHARAARMAERSSTPYVYNAEGALCPTRLRDKRVRKAAFLRLFERAVVREADAIHAVTDKEAGDMIAQGAAPNRVHVIPNAVSAPTETVSRTGARRRLGWREDEFVVLYLGRRTAMKSPDVLLEGALELLGQGKMRLVLAGPDEGMAAQLAAIAERHGVADRVAQLDTVVGGQRLDLWSGADLFALPSLSEGLPLGPLEAAAHGLPLLVSPQCNLPQVAEYDAGRIVPVDHVAVGNALAEFVADRETLRRCADGARRMVAEEFALTEIVTRLESLYRELSR